MGKDNLMLCLDMVVLDITMEEMNMKTVILEAIPSLVIFVVEVSAYPSEISLVSVVIALMSMFIIGKKSNGTSKKKELVAEKREIEEKMALIEEPATKGGRESMKMVAAVFGVAKAKKVQEDVEIEVAGRRKSMVGAAEETRDVEMAVLGGGLPGAAEGGEGGGEKETLRQRADRLEREADRLKRELAEAEAGRETAEAGRETERAGRETESAERETERVGRESAERELAAKKEL